MTKTIKWLILLGMDRPAETAALQPLIDSLLLRLEQAGLPATQPSPDTAAFARWYLQVVQALEQYVASTDDRPPMTRREVELMCRCAVTATTLKEAIELVVDYCAMLYPRAGRLALQFDHGQAQFLMDSLRSRTTAISSVVDITGLHAFFQLFCWLIGQRIELSGVGVSRGSREDLLPFLVLFDAPALAEGACYGLLFDESLLAAPVVRTRGEMQAFLDEYPCRIFGLDAHADTKQQVLALLGAAAQHDTVMPGLQQLAAVLGMSEITLRRRLKEEGSSYRELRDACLVEAAQYLLEQGEASIEEIAARLGYSDATAFRRSFKRCTGLAPSAFRRPT